MRSKAYAGEMALMNAETAAPCIIRSTSVPAPTVLPASAPVVIRNPPGRGAR